MDAPRPPLNELGPVAASYHELQSLPLLFDAARRPPVPPQGSAWQAVRALFQATEVALVTLAELADQVTARWSDDDVAAAVRALNWMTSFAKAWVDLAWRIRDVAPVAPNVIPQIADTPRHRLMLTDSPNWQAVFVAESRLAEALLDRSVSSIVPSVGDEIALPLLRYVMLQRIGLEYCVVEGAPAVYGDLIRPDEVRKAVLDQQLAGRTVFTQFRAAHQIPELLVDAVNDHLENAVLALRDGDLHAAEPMLHRVDRLLDATVLSVDILADHLRTGEYHTIRENLGMTSGSHSTGIHYHLMRDLYPELVAAMGRIPTDRELAEAVQRSVRTIGRHLDRWRLAHLNLPRINLGGAGTATRSLAGSRDAVQTVSRLRETALHRDRQQEPPGDGFRATDWESGELALAAVEGELLRAIAERTKSRFTDVQQRTGYFAGVSEFQAPSRRVGERPRRDGDG